MSASSGCFCAFNPSVEMIAIGAVIVDVICRGLAYNGEFGGGVHAAELAVGMVGHGLCARLYRRHLRHQFDLVATLFRGVSITIPRLAGKALTTIARCCRYSAIGLG